MIRYLLPLLLLLVGCSERKPYGYDYDEWHDANCNALVVRVVNGTRDNEFVKGATVVMPLRNERGVVFAYHVLGVTDDWGKVRLPHTCWVKSIYVRCDLPKITGTWDGGSRREGVLTIAVQEDDDLS